MTISSNCSHVLVFALRVVHTAIESQQNSVVKAVQLQAAQAMLQLSHCPLGAVPATLVCSMSLEQQLNGFGTNAGWPEAL